MDQDLVERAQRGDRDAYERLARASADRMYAVAYQITRDRDRADDALQQALVAMWHDLPSLRDTSRFEGWTYRLVTRACLMELRGRRRANIVALPDDDQSRGLRIRRGTWPFATSYNAPLRRSHPITVR